MKVQEMEAVIKYDNNDLDCLLALSNNSGMTLKHSFHSIFNQYFVSDKDNKLQYFKDTFYSKNGLKMNGDFDAEKIFEIIVKFADEVNTDDGLRRYIRFLLTMGTTLERFDMGYLSIKPAEITQRSIVQCMLEEFDNLNQQYTEKSKEPKNESKNETKK